jgi:hypothetical protein
MSDTITREVELTPLVSHMSIQLPPSAWAGKILGDIAPDALKHQGRFGAGWLDRSRTSPEIAQLLEEKGFDVKTQAQMMTYFYEEGRFRTPGVPK